VGKVVKALPLLVLVVLEAVEVEAQGQ